MSRFVKVRMRIPPDDPTTALINLEHVTRLEDVPDTDRISLTMVDGTTMLVLNTSVRELLESQTYPAAWDRPKRAGRFPGGPPEGP